MKGHNYGKCRTCERLHVHPKGTLGRKLIFSAPIERAAKISRALKGQVRSKQHCMNLSRARTGQHYPKLSEAKKKWRRVFPNLVPTPTLAYILAVTLGDGCAYRNCIHLRVISQIFAERFKEALTRIGLHPSYWRKDRTYNVTGYSATLYSWYKSLSQNQIEEIARSFPRSFLCGFYESEGSLMQSRIPHKNHYHNNIRITIANTKGWLISLTTELLLGLGLHPKQKAYTKFPKSRPLILHIVNLYRRKEVESFLEQVSPCIRRNLCVY